MRIERNYFVHRLVALFDQAIAQRFQLVEQRNLLVVAVLQLVQRLTDRIDVARAQHFADQLQLAATALFFDALRQLDGGQQLFIQRDLLQGVLAQIDQFGTQAF